MKNRIYKPGDVVESRHIFEKDGKFYEGWVTDETNSMHPDRFFSGCSEITESEYLRLRSAWESEAAAIEERREAAKMKADMYAAYVEALPFEIGGLFRRGCDLEDEYGNYILAIPREAAAEKWPLKKLAKFVAEYAAEYDGE